jgi:hypothetical protein
MMEYTLGPSDKDNRPSTSVNKRQCKDYYNVCEHGIQWIVYRNFSTFGGIMCQEDSRWMSKDQADKHCRLLNEYIKQQNANVHP